MTSRARGNIHTHALCCFRTQNPRFREYARLLSSATERSIEEIDGRRAEITDISGNIPFFFFFGKNFADPGRMFLIILKKIGVIYFQSRRRVNEFLVSKETVVLRRWERSKQKFGFIKRVDKG